MQAQKYSIKQLSRDERPREKLRTLGISALSNVELLGILLQSGTRQLTATDLGRSLMTRVDNDLNQLGRLTIKELMTITGIGEVRAMVILAAFELGRRRNTVPQQMRKTVRNSAEMAAFLRTLLQDYRHEVFAVAFLNRANRVRHFEVMSQGGISSTTVDTRIIVRKALEQDALNLVLCHNHPSGNLIPSKSDIGLTQKIQQAASLFDIRVIDHIIISQDGFYSFADAGYMDL